MIRLFDLISTIEKYGLLFLCMSIIALYWIFDAITSGPLLNRLLITISLFAYGILTQFLINYQKTAKKSLQAATEDLALTNEQLAQANEKLKNAYAWMRDNRDELKQQMYEEDIGFLINEDGRIEGVTDHALVVIKEPRDTVLGSNLARLIETKAQSDFLMAMKQAWKGIPHHFTIGLLMQQGDQREFHIKFTRLDVMGRKLLLMVMY